MYTFRDCESPDFCNCDSTFLSVNCCPVTPTGMKKKIGSVSPLTVMGIHVSVSGHARKLHNTCTHIHQNPKSRSSRTSIVYTFSSIQSAAVSLFVFISTQTNVYTHRGNIQERQELPPPADDPPAAPVRRGTYCFAYALSLAIALFSTSFEISVIITHFLVTP